MPATEPPPVAERLLTLTPRQRAVYDAIMAFRKAHGYGPTVRELGDAVGIGSPNGVVCHLKLMEKKGLLVNWKSGGGHNLARCLDVVTETKPCPACGQAVPCKGGRF